MKTILISILLFVQYFCAFSQNEKLDVFTNWKKVYNKSNYGIDSAHYIYVRVQVCQHSHEDGSPVHLSKFEVRYPDQLSDSTTLFGNLYFVGTKNQIIDQHTYSTTDTTVDFFPVTQGEIFNEELALSFNDLTDLYLILQNVKVEANFEKTAQWKNSLERTKKLVESANKKKSPKISPKIKHVAGLGNRG